LKGQVYDSWLLRWYHGLVGPDSIAVFHDATDSTEESNAPLESYGLAALLWALLAGLGGRKRFEDVNRLRILIVFGFVLIPDVERWWPREFPRVHKPHFGCPAFAPLYVHLRASSYLIRRACDGLEDNFS
jgi:hypothetical protein